MLVNTRDALDAIGGDHLMDIRCVGRAALLRGVRIPLAAPGPIEMRWPIEHAAADAGAGSSSDPWIIIDEHAGVHSPDLGFDFSPDDRPCASVQRIAFPGNTARAVNDSR